MKRRHYTRRGFMSSHYSGNRPTALRAPGRAGLALAVAACLAVNASGDARSDSARADRRPGEFAVLFSFGYGDDDLFPQDRAKYEEVIKKVKAGGFNVVMGTYADWKVEMCRKHGLKLMVNLLTRDYHVYKNVEPARALCRKLRGDQTIWGYHLFSDMNYKTAQGRNRDIANVHEWDPTHPSFVGSHNLSGNSRLTSPDVFGYYDFHWQRGPHMNFPHLLSAWKDARGKDARFYRWMRATSGLAGKGNPNRCLYTANTSIAFGLKGILWFIGQEMMDRKTWQWNQFGRDICKVNAEIAPLAPEIMKLGNPTAVYSTPTTRTLNDRPKADPAPAVPPPLEAIPQGHWLRVTSGQAVLGLFQDEQRRDAVFAANHNAYAPQEMALELAAAVRSVEQFDRKTRKWKALEVSKKSVRFRLEPAGGELLRVEK